MDIVSLVVFKWLDPSIENTKRSAQIKAAATNDDESDDDDDGEVDSNQD